MKAEVAHFTTEQMVDMVGLLSPCMDDYLYVCDFKEDYYQISPNAVKRFCLPADHFHNVVEMHRQVVYPDDLDLLLVELELLSTGRKVFHNLHYRWMGKNHETIRRMDHPDTLWAASMRSGQNRRRTMSAACWENIV